MDNQLFRKKSIERISSPEQLHDYLRVTSPRLWMVLSAITVLLLGLIIFAATVSLESTLQVQASVEKGVISIEMPADRKDSVKPDMPVRIAGKKGTISYVFIDSDKLNVSVAMDEGAEASALPDGLYDAEIITDSVKPISFLLN